MSDFTEQEINAVYRAMRDRRDMRPILGVEAKLKTNDIERALALIRHSVWLWLGFFFVIAGLTHA